MPNNPYEERTVAVPSRVGVARLSDGSVTTSTTYTTGIDFFIPAEPRAYFDPRPSPPPISLEYAPVDHTRPPWDQPSSGDYGVTGSNYPYNTFTAPVTGTYTIFPSGPHYSIEVIAGSQVYRDRNAGVTIDDRNGNVVIYIPTGQNWITNEGALLGIAPTAAPTAELAALTAKVEEQANQIQFLIDTLHEKGLLV